MKDKVKGEKNGLCNRKACQSPNYVLYYNDSTRKYYCPKCAELINYWSMKDAGREICKRES